MSESRERAPNYCEHEKLSQTKNRTTRCKISRFQFMRNRRFQLCFLLSLLFLLLIKSQFSNHEIIIPVVHSSHLHGMKDYLVYSDKCKIRSHEPFIPEMWKYFHREDYEPCSTIGPLTRVEYNFTAKRYLLSMIDENKRLYTALGGWPKCCFSVIKRDFKGEIADKKVSFGECIKFENSVFLPNTVDNILVKCHSNGLLVYINGHPMIPERPEIQNRFKAWENRGTHKPISVMIIGIDSISRINLLRSMPRTAQYLYDNEWFEMPGYNVVDDGTFRNLIAMLTGYNISLAAKFCNAGKLNGFDKCPFIWDSFKKYGYVTAYAEDETLMSTFDLAKVGFEKPPVDHYLRPFLLAAEASIKSKRKSGLKFCLGFQHSADFVYDYALEFDSRYRDEPYFGLFWTNSFSHNTLGDPTSMDAKILEYFEEFSRRGIYNRSILIFLSDHGMRFGRYRQTFSGSIEERLPFLFIWLPPHLKDSHPEFVTALNTNKNRLTNPFDMHMTLKQFLNLSGRADELHPTVSCPNCQSLLKPVPHSRSCEDIEINPHMCSCLPYTQVDADSEVVKRAAEHVVNFLNNYIMGIDNGSLVEKCAKLSLSYVKYAYRATRVSDNEDPKSYELYRFLFVTHPNDGMFETTVMHTLKTGEFRKFGKTSRVEYYSVDSYCIKDARAQHVCSCKKKRYLLL